MTHWSLKKVLYRLSAFDRKILRKIFGPPNWRITTNTELDELIKHRNIINDTNDTNRLPETGIVKKIYKWKPFTGRPVGRPKS